MKSFLWFWVQKYFIFIMTSNYNFLQKHIAYHQSVIRQGINCFVRRKQLIHLQAPRRQIMDDILFSTVIQKLKYNLEKDTKELCLEWIVFPQVWNLLRTCIRNKYVTRSKVPSSSKLMIFLNSITYFMTIFFYILRWTRTYYAYEWWPIDACWWKNWKICSYCKICVY